MSTVDKPCTDQECNRMIRETHDAVIEIRGFMADQSRRTKELEDKVGGKEGLESRMQAAEFTLGPVKAGFWVAASGFIVGVLGFAWVVTVYVIRATGKNP